MITITLLFKNIKVVVSYISLTCHFEHIKEAAYHHAAYVSFLIHSHHFLSLFWQFPQITGSYIANQKQHRDGVAAVLSVTWRYFILCWCFFPLKWQEGMSYRSNALFPQSTDLIFLPPSFVRILQCFPPDMIRKDVPVIKTYYVTRELYFLLGCRREIVHRLACLRPGWISHHVTWPGTLAFSHKCQLGSLL